MPVGCSTQRQSPEGPNSLLDPDSTPPERLQPKDPGLPAQGDRDTEPTARRRSFGRPVYIVTTACGGGGLASDVQATGRGASDAGTREEMESRKRRRMPDGTVRLPKSRAYILLVAVVFNLTWGLVKPWLKGSTFLLRKDVKKCIREVGGGVQNPAAACRARRADCQRVSEREKCGGSKLTWHGLPSLTAAPQTVADAHHAPHTHLRGFLLGGAGSGERAWICTGDRRLGVCLRLPFAGGSLVFLQHAPGQTTFLVCSFHIQTDTGRHGRCAQAPAGFRWLPAPY